LPESITEDAVELNELNRTIGSALKAKAKQGFTNVMDDFVERLEESITRPVKITLSTEDYQISPGEQKRIRITIQLPRNLKSNRMYKVKFNVVDQIVRFKINCIHERTENGTNKRK
jgi:hypothetical protein